MSVPDYQTLMLPLLQAIHDGHDHTNAELIDTLAADFDLSDQDRSELLPSGQQFRFDNRVTWARSYLKQAGLLENTGRGKFRITERGLQVLASKPPYINQAYLEQFPEFIEFKNRSNKTQETSPIFEPDTARTPEEILEASYQRLRNKLVQDILERVKACSPRFFERLVVDLLVKMGYGGSRKDAGRAIGQSSDGGVDGIINEDRLGLDVVYIQAKRWENAVGRPLVQAFAGSLEGFRAKKGVMLTTSSFTKEALDYVSRIEKKIVLVDGEQLAQFMIDYGVGVNETVTYTVSRIDLDYFDEE